MCSAFTAVTVVRALTPSALNMVTAVQSVAAREGPPWSSVVFGYVPSSEC